jgi:hypothetical protein
MNDSLLITILILALITILFLLVASQQGKTSQNKKTKIYDKLYSLKESVGSEETSIRRDAIIKLDNLLSKSLQYRYSNDKNCGDNLKLAKKLFRKNDYQRIWDAHKIRNNIVHNDLDISKQEAIKAYNIYKLSIGKVLK